MSQNSIVSDPAFPDFLKSWRQRRRLSQFDLSLEAGMSQRHISFLETGRSNPSRFSISQLADALEMPAAEIDAMLVAAGFAARTSKKGWDGETQKAIDQSIDHVLASHVPFPAVSVDRIWNLIKANEPAQRFFAMIGSKGDTNLIREILAPGNVRNCILNWQEVARALMRLLELEVARRPHDLEAQKMQAELRELEDIGELLRQPVTGNAAPVLTIQIQVDGVVLELFSLIATIGMSIDATLDDLRIETLLPANDVSRNWFQEHMA